MPAPKHLPSTFTVPGTIEGVAGLLKARTWERAAIVYAWTTADNPGGRGKNHCITTGVYGLQEFANLGLAGLRSNRTVQNYRNAWQWAIDNGYAQAVKPGDAIRLPEAVPFPPGHNPAWAETEYDADYAVEAESAGVTFGLAKRAGANKDAIKAAIKADPEVEQAAWDAIQEKQADKSTERRKGYGVTCPPPPPRRDSLNDTTFGGHMDAAMDEAGRRDAIADLLSLSQKVRDAVDSLKSEHGHTGVEDEVNWIHQISHNLSEAQWALAEFAVEEANQ